ncbi:MAG: GNAT family N-acetyltransferase [Burkholderiaceae bacterium]
MHELSESASQTAEEVEALLLQAHEESPICFPPPSDFSAYAKKITEHARIVGLRVDGTLVAFLAFYCNDLDSRLAYMSMLVVRSDYRGRGLAKRLVQQSLHHLTQEGFLVYRLEVGKEKSEAIALYRTMGFTETGQEREANLYMERRIGPDDAGRDPGLAEQAVSLKANVIANYGGQIYMTVANLAMVPLYLHYMGAEAYGLVGFFAMLQMWFQLLDLGLTPTMSREMARFHGGAKDILSLRRLMRAFEGIFVGTALLGSAAIIGAAGPISTYWLKAQNLPLSEVRHAIMLMALIIALRWISGLYRSAIAGLERQIWLNGFNVAIVTMRAVLVVPFFLLAGSSPTYFFSFQLAVALFETAWLVRQTYRLLPLARHAGHLRWELAPLRGVLTFSLSIAFTSSVWVLITQTDKLVLSRMLPLTEYGYFTLAVLVAGGVMLISGPISTALQPRLTSILAAGDERGVVLLYRKATQIVAVLCIPAALLLAFFPREVLWAWTGDATAAAHAAPVLSLYALGNGVLALSAMPYLLQFAAGKMRLHVIGGALVTILLIPALIWGTTRYGATGAAYAWLVSNLAYLLLWVPLIHQRFMPGQHMQWLTADICIVAAPPMLAAAMLHAAVALPDDRLMLSLVLAAIGLLLMALAAAASPYARETCGYLWRRQLFGFARQG